MDLYALLWHDREEEANMHRGEVHSKITVILSSEEFTRFHEYCRHRGYKKSTLIAKLIRDHLGVEETKQLLAESPQSGEQKRAH